MGGVDSEGDVMDYDQQLRNIKNGLYWLDVNAKHAIELRESFKYPAYDDKLREFIRGTNNVRYYDICLKAIYFEFIMTLMRMHNSYEKDTACFSNVFKLLSRTFVKHFESNCGRAISDLTEKASTDYENLKGSHIFGSLKIVRHNMFAHTGIKFNRKQVAHYGYAEKLIDKTLPILNALNVAIYGKPEPYDKISGFWKGYAMDFWNNFMLGKTRPTSG